MLIPKKAYHKKDLFDILGVSEEDRKNGNWQTGYIKYKDRFFVFANIGGAGRTGHDYDNHWEGDRLVWYGKTNSRIGQPIIDEMLSGYFPVLIFTRTKDRDPFVYEGSGYAYNVIDDSPVKVWWDIELEMLEEEVSVIINTVLSGPEAPDDKERKAAIIYKRSRNGQNRLKKKQLDVYDGQCCITGCGVMQVLKACHIEPHYLRGNNHSSNGLLMRADVHDLFDAGLIAIAPDTLEVHISDQLIGSEYEALDGVVVRTRNDGQRPDREALNERWGKFLRRVVV